MPWSGEVVFLAAIQTSLLVRVVAVEAAVVVVGIAAVLGHGLWTGVAEQRDTARLARGRTALESILDRGGGLGVLASLPRRLRLEVLLGVAPSLAGAQRLRLTALADELGILASAEARCRSRWWWRRLHGARLCTLLGGGAMAVPPLLDDQRKEVRAQAAQWVAQSHDEELIHRLLRILDLDNGTTRFAVKDSLVRIGRPVVGPLAEHLAVRAGLSLAPALEVALALADPALLPAVLALCTDEVPLVRALAASVAGAIGGGPAVEAVSLMLGDDAAEVRAAAARALGRAGHWPAAPSLFGLLSDASWEVRLQAAVALRTLGTPGMLFLRRAASSGDNDASDAARLMLDLPDSALRTL